MAGLCHLVVRCYPDSPPPSPLLSQAKGGGVFPIASERRGSFSDRERKEASFTDRKRKVVEVGWLIPIRHLRGSGSNKFFGSAGILLGVMVGLLMLQVGQSRARKWLICVPATG